MSNTTDDTVGLILRNQLSITNTGCDPNTSDFQNCCINNPNDTNCQNGNPCIRGTANYQTCCTNFPNSLNCQNIDACSSLTPGTPAFQNCCINNPTSLSCRNGNPCVRGTANYQNCCTNFPGSLNCQNIDACSSLTPGTPAFQNCCINNPTSLSCRTGNPCVIGTPNFQNCCTTFPNSSNCQTINIDPCNTLVRGTPAFQNCCINNPTSLSCQNGNPCVAGTPNFQNCCTNFPNSLNCQNIDACSLLTPGTPTFANCCLNNPTSLSCQNPCDPSNPNINMANCCANFPQSPNCLNPNPCIPGTANYQNCCINFPNSPNCCVSFPQNCNSSSSCNFEENLDPGCYDCVNRLLNLHTKYRDINVPNPNFPTNNGITRPSENLIRLCNYRSNLDSRYRAWIAEGKAWWLVDNVDIKTDDVTTRTGWEAKEDHPLPRWWWRYPEIPDPSSQWIALGNRRWSHLPNDISKIPERISVTTADPDWAKLTQTGGDGGYVYSTVDPEFAEVIFGNENTPFPDANGSDINQGLTCTAFTVQQGILWLLQTGNVNLQLAQQIINANPPEPFTNLDSLVECPLTINSNGNSCVRQLINVNLLLSKYPFLTANLINSYINASVTLARTSITFNQVGLEAFSPNISSKKRIRNGAIEGFSNNLEKRENINKNIKIEKFSCTPKRKIIQKPNIENFTSISKKKNNNNKVFEGFTNVPESCTTLPPSNAVIVAPQLNAGLQFTNINIQQTLRNLQDLRSSCTANCDNWDLTEIKDLCRVRSNNDVRYATWIAAGKAWWFGKYTKSSSSVFGQGWEEDLIAHPLPRWWWRYPEIPAPSDEWLCGADQNILTGRRIERRLTHLPPAQYNIKGWVQRVYLSNVNSKGQITSQGGDIQKYVPITPQQDLELYCANPIQTELYILEFVRSIEIIPNEGNIQQAVVTNAGVVPVPTNSLSFEGFENTNANNNSSQIWTIIWICIIVIICILFFLYFRNTSGGTTLY